VRVRAAFQATLGDKNQPRERRSGTFRFTPPAVGAATPAARKTRARCQNSACSSPPLAAYYEEVRARVHQWLAPISTEQLWRKPYAYGNSIGHLLLHLTANLNFYIGRVAHPSTPPKQKPLNFRVPHSRRRRGRGFRRSLTNP